MTRFPPGTSGVTIYSQQFSSGNLEFGEPGISEKTKNENMKENFFQTLGFGEIRLLALTVLLDDQ